MEMFRRFAFAVLVRDCAFLALGTLVLMIGLSFNPALALKVGAFVALGNAALLMLRSARLTDEKVLVSEPWSNLEPHERPVRDYGAAMACRELRQALLVFAQGSAGVAAVFSAAAVLLGL
jgi:hypothetical protein